MEILWDYLRSETKKHFAHEIGQKIGRELWDPNVFCWNALSHRICGHKKWHWGAAIKIAILQRKNFFPTCHYGIPNNFHVKSMIASQELSRNETPTSCTSKKSQFTREFLLDSPRNLSAQKKTRKNNLMTSPGDCNFRLWAPGRRHNRGRLCKWR